MTGSKNQSYDSKLSLFLRQFIRIVYNSTYNDRRGPPWTTNLPLKSTEVMGNTGWLPYCGSVTWTDDIWRLPPEVLTKLSPCLNWFRWLYLFLQGKFMWVFQVFFPFSQNDWLHIINSMFFFFSKFGYVSSTQRVYLSYKGPGSLPFFKMKLW